MANIQFNLPNYNYDALRAMNVKDVRREYSRLRSIARKRLERLSQNPEFTKSQTYLRYRNTFTSLKDIKPNQVARLSKKLSEVYQFLGMETSTVTGMKDVSKRIIAGLQAKGYTAIKTDKDLRRFGEYMDFNRALKKGGKYDSEKVVEMMDATEKAGISAKQVQQDFTFWMNNYDSIKDVVPAIKGAKKGSKVWIRSLKELLSSL